MNTLELVNEETGIVYHLETNHYGIIMEKYHKIAKAIAIGWSLIVRTRLGEIIYRSEHYEVQCQG